MSSNFYFWISIIKTTNYFHSLSTTYVTPNFTGHHNLHLPSDSPHIPKNTRRRVCTKPQTHLTPNSFPINNPKN